MRDDSIWKKEISLGRKRKPAPEQQQQEQPQQKAQEPTQQPAPNAEPGAFWKKELSFGRKKSEAAAVAPEPAESKEEALPFWKREVSLSRKQADAVPQGDEPSVWKKEITLGRRKQKEVERLAEEAARAFAPAEAERAVVPTPIEPEVIAEPAAIAEPEIVPGLAPEIVPEPEIVPQPVGDPNAEIEIFFARHSTPEPEAVVPTPVEEPQLSTPPAPLPEHITPTFEPLPEPPPLPPEAESVLKSSAPMPAPQPYVPQPVPEPSAAAVPPSPPGRQAPSVPEPLPTRSIPEAMPAPASPAPEETETLPAAARAVVNPPVPSAELPSLPAEPKVPFWKKEISLSRKGGTKPAAAATPAPRPAASQPATRGDDGARPFWRKQIAFGRKGQTSAPAGEASIWKKEITLTRKKDVASATAAPKDAAPATAVPKDASAEKVPFWKKEIGGKKGGKKKAALTPTAAAKPASGAAAPKAKKASAPFWKRELSLKSISLPGLPSVGSKQSGGKRDHGKVKRIVGLKVGASQIAAARVVNNGAAELLQVARHPLEHGIVVGGELRDPEALANELKSFFAKNKLPRRNVRLGIASNRIGVRIFDVAGIEDEAQLENAIQFRAQEALPIPLDEAVLDYHVLAESADAEGRPIRRILLVVAYRELVDRYVAACKRAGIALIGVDLEAFALLRALAAPREEDAPATAALVGVAIGHDRSTFAVSDGRVCEFTRVLEWGGSSLNVAIARALDRAPSEVEEIKRAISLEDTATIPEGLTQEQWGAVFDAVRRQLQSFARELVSSLQFYQNQPGSLGIGEIVLTGGTAHLQGLAPELQRLMGVQVRVGDPLARLKVAKKVGEGEPLGSLAVAIGLGIED